MTIPPELSVLLLMFAVVGLSSPAVLGEPNWICLLLLTVIVVSLPINTSHLKQWLGQMCVSLHH